MKASTNDFPPEARSNAFACSSSDYSAKSSEEIATKRHKRHKNLFVIFVPFCGDNSLLDHQRGERGSRCASRQQARSRSLEYVLTSFKFGFDQLPHKQVLHFFQFLQTQENNF